MVGGDDVKIKESIGSRIFDVINVLFLGILALVCLYPMLHVIFSAFSESNLLMKHEGLLLKPLGFTIKPFIMVFHHPLIIKSYLNTFIAVGGSLVVNMLLTLLAAYALSRKNVKVSAIFMKFVIVTMYFSGGMVPLFLAVKSYGLLNNYLALILPTAVNTFNLIILRTSFMAIPDSMEESAKVDGANDFQVLFCIMIPLAMSSIAVIILYYTVQHWNAWFNAMIFLNERKMYPLQLVLREILIQNDTQSMTMEASVDGESFAEAVKYAVIVVATLPILCLYPFLQKYFVKGVLVGAVKG